MPTAGLSVLMLHTGEIAVRMVPSELAQGLPEVVLLRSTGAKSASICHYKKRGTSLANLRRHKRASRLPAQRAAASVFA